MRNRSISAAAPRTSRVQPAAGTAAFCYMMREGTSDQLADYYGNGPDLTLDGTLTNVWDNPGFVTLSGDNLCEVTYADEDAMRASIFWKVGQLTNLPVNHVILAYDEYLAADPASGTHVFNFGRSTLEAVGGYRITMTTAGVVRISGREVGGTSETGTGLDDVTSALGASPLQHLIEIEGQSDPGNVTVHHYVDGILEASETWLTTAAAATIGSQFGTTASSNEWRDVIFARAGGGSTNDLIHPGGQFSRLLGYQGAYDATLAEALAKELTDNRYEAPTLLYNR